MLHQSRGMLQSDPKTEDRISWTGGVVSSLLFAFSPVMWSQSTIVEVYSLNAFFLIFIFLLSYWWMRRPSDSLLCATAFVFGLGLTNYQVLLLAMLPLLVVIMLRDPQLFRSFVVAGLPFLLVVYHIKTPTLGADADGNAVYTALPMLSHPTHPDTFVYLALNFLLLTLCYFFLPRGRVVALTLLMAEIGVAFYGYMPLASDLRNPPMNWAYPRTWEGFIHAITRGQYERLNPTDVLSMRFVEQVGSYLVDLRGQFTLPVALLGFLPFTVWQIRIGGKHWRALDFAICLSVLGSVILVLQKLLGGDGGARLDKLPMAGVLLLMAIGGLTILVTLGWEMIDQCYRDWKEKKYQDAGTHFVLLAAVKGTLIAVLYFLVLMIRNISAPLKQEATASRLSPEQIGNINLHVAALSVMVAGFLVMIPLLYWLVRSRRFELRLVIDKTSQRWILATLAGFLVMSLLLIVLANPKGDVQDNFIQRVKFISSHALFAFWIGYGLVFGLAWTTAFFRRIPGVRVFSLGAALCLPLIPLGQNAWNDELIRLSGGAEQNGHDFGWQFGNYQLRGAEAILEELNADEEPLPNPFYPDAMEMDSVFYGGTDPGRFVPTYMIYSARVREDVFLITQNALADNTYMNVMRDLYGDQIWIPAHHDSAAAFRVYVEEVQAGKRKPHADLQITDGRVQVSGALGVMEINGILAEMIFDHNSPKHAFYVEESYVIEWMYPHLTPHGLIMKINADRTPLSARTIRDDMDFWDWYTRRHLSNPKFLRDVVARKSFSKLRSAIAGLYANRGRMREAEHAFNEARLLYPLSPEAVFRLAQEVLLRRARFEDSLDLMDQFAKADPGNTRVPDFANRLRSIQVSNEEIFKLEGLRRQQKLDVESALRLAELYRKAKQTSHAVSIVRQLVAQPGLPVKAYYDAALLAHKAENYKVMHEALQACQKGLPADNRTPPELYLNMAKMYADAQMGPEMAGQLQLYLLRRPNDWKAWLDLAYIELTLGRTPAAADALRKARAAGGMEAERTIMADSRFRRIAEGAVEKGPLSPESPEISPEAATPEQAAPGPEETEAL